MPRNMASKQIHTKGKRLHMYEVRVKNQQKQGAKYANTRKNEDRRYPRYLYMIFGMSCVLIIMAAAIAEGGRYLPAFIFSAIGVCGIYYTAWGCNCE